jgi:hypothetical protein
MSPCLIHFIALESHPLCKNVPKQSAPHHKTGSTSTQVAGLSAILVSLSVSST